MFTTLTCALIVQGGAAASLPPTVVIAPRSEQPASATFASVQVITAEELERTGERSLPRAIGKAAGAGVWVQETNLGGGSPILRGWIGPHVLIVVDGVRLNDSTTRLGPNQSLNTIDPAIVDSVEILRGPAAVPYGSDAVGGVISIRTKRRAPLASGEQAWQGRLEARHETVTSGSAGSIAQSWADERNGVFALGSLFEWNDLESADETQDFTGYHGNGVFGAWVHRFDDYRSLQVSGRIHRDLDVPRTDRLVAGFGQTQPSNSQFDFKVQDGQGYLVQYDDFEAHGFADRMQVRGFLRTYTEEREIVATGSTTLRFEKDDILGYGLGLDLEKAVGETHLLRYGLDFERDDIDSARTNTTGAGVTTPGTPAFADNSRYWSSGIFLTDELLGLDPWSVTLGARYSLFDFGFDDFVTGEEQSGDFDAFTGSVQIARRLTDRLRVTGTLAQSFRAPHLDDLAKNATIFGGEEFANPDLEPEEALTAELAFDYVDPLWSGSLAAWNTLMEDYIGRVLISDGGTPSAGDDDYLRENVGEVNIYGLELRLSRKLGDEQAEFSAETSVAWTRGRQDDDTINASTGEATFDDVPARRIPPLHATAAVLYEPARDQTLDWARLALTVADEQDDLNPEDLSDPRIDPEGTAGWAVLDFDCSGRLGRSGSRARWNFGLHNILDQQYRVHGSGLDAPGFGAVVGLSWSY